MDYPTPCWADRTSSHQGGQRRINHEKHETHERDFFVLVGIFDRSLDNDVAMISSGEYYPMMRRLSWLSFILIPVLVLAGCVPVSPAIQPTQEMIIPSQTHPTATFTVSLTSTPILMVTETPLLTATQLPLSTLRPESVKETMQPLIKDPMNCVSPCFLGITPGNTSLDKARAFFDPLGFRHREGTDPNSGREFYSVGYEDIIGRDSNVTFFISDNLVVNIEITPEILKQKEGSAREWTAYSPETLLKKYGTPSRVEFGLYLGQVNTTINMIMYFDTIDLIALYSGYEPTLGHPHSLQLCPFTFPFDHVRLWMGPNPPDPPLTGSPDPLEKSIPLEKATSLTVDQFTQLMLGDPQNACFDLNGEVFQ
jgi:hypothetical protein